MKKEPIFSKEEQIPESYITSPESPHQIQQQIQTINSRNNWNGNRHPACRLTSPLHFESPFEQSYISPKHSHLTDNHQFEEPVEYQESRVTDFYTDQEQNNETIVETISMYGSNTREEQTNNKITETSTKSPYHEQPVLVPVTPPNSDFAVDSIISKIEKNVSQISNEEKIAFCVEPGMEYMSLCLMKIVRFNKREMFMTDHPAMMPIISAFESEEIIRSKLMDTILCGRQFWNINRQLLNKLSGEINEFVEEKSKQNKNVHSSGSSGSGSVFCCSGKKEEKKKKKTDVQEEISDEHASLKKIEECISLMSEQKKNYYAENIFSINAQEVEKYCFYDTVVKDVESVFINADEKRMILKNGCDDEINEEKMDLKREEKLEQFEKIQTKEHEYKFSKYESGVVELLTEEKSAKEQEAKMGLETDRGVILIEIMAMCVFEIMRIDRSRADQTKEIQVINLMNMDSLIINTDELLRFYYDLNSIEDDADIFHKLGNHFYKLTAELE